MNHKIKAIFLLLLCLAISCVTVPRKPDTIKAFDNRFNVISVLKGEDAESFYEYWIKRETVNSAKPVFNCKIDVTHNGISTRWLYDSRKGLCQILTMRIVPVYKLKEFKKINLRLGIN